MRRKKSITIILLVLTAINIAIFIFRDHFYYSSYGDDASLYGSCDQSCFKKWELYKNDYPAEDLREAKRISDSIIGDKNISAGDKIIRIGNFVYHRFKNQNGRPNTDLLTASPLTQYKMLCSSDTLQLWCGNFAEIFSYFCWSQGIAARNIEIMNPGDHHVLTECYVQDMRQWIMVDPTNNLLTVTNGKKILNLQTFKEGIQKKTALFEWQLSGDSVIYKSIDTNAAFIRNYYSKENPCYYYHRVDNEKAYRMTDKIKRYILPVSWYDIYDNKGQTNTGFYLKLIFMIAWIISFFVFILSRTKFRT